MNFTPCLDYYLSVEGDKPKRADAETFQSKVIVIFCIIESSWGNLFSLSVQLQIQSREALVDIAYQTRPTVTKGRIPSYNKTAAEGPREGRKQNHSNCILCQILYSRMHLLSYSMSFRGSPQFDCICADSFHCRTLCGCTFIIRDALFYFG